MRDVTVSRNLLPPLANGNEGFVIATVTGKTHPKSSVASALSADEISSDIFS